MTAERFTEIAEALYGPAWRNSIAIALGVDDRVVRRWTGGAIIPAGVARDLALLCLDRATALQRLAGELYSQQNGEPHNGYTL
jgi:hypothetical protein